MRNFHHDQQGFTLAEVITVISIMSILMTIAMPMMITWYRNASLQAASRDLYSSIKLTQANAARRNQICAISFDDGDGYVAYVDTNRNFKQDAGEPELASQRWRSYISVSIGAGGVDFPVNADNKPTLAFRPNSLPASNLGLPNGSVILQSATGRSLQVRSSISGNVTISRI